MDRAWDFAGMHLADCRSVNAYQDRRTAAHRLFEAARHCPTAERLMVRGAILAVEGGEYVERTRANDNLRGCGADPA